MRKSFLILTLMLSTLNVLALDQINAVKLHRTSGEDVTILLDARPVVTFSDNSFVITTHMSVMTFLANDIQKFTYEYVDPSGISQPSMSNATYYIDNGAINFRNIEPRSKVSVYTIDGKIVGRVTADSNGNASLRFVDDNINVYVIETSTITFKIHKS